MKIYAVERVEGKRIVNGFVEYNIKWKSYPRSENTWEPAHHIYCHELVAAFEKSERNKLAKACTLELANGKQKNKKIQKSSFGFENGLKPLKIIGATGTFENLLYIMTWKNSDYKELVPAKLAKTKCPQLVIKFYEERLTWISEDDTD